MNKILVVDDDSSVRTSLQELLQDQEYDVAAAGNASEAFEQIKSFDPDLIISDVQMPGMSGIEAFRQIHQSHPKLPVIIMTAFGTTETAIEATKLGAFDYQLKPFEPADMLDCVERALESVRLMRRQVHVGAAQPQPTGDTMIGRSPAMQEVYKAIGRVAPTDASVLIRGETGSGKELIARAVFQHSNRSDKPMLMVNCVAIPDTLLEAEIFGHEKGAFTGAQNRRIGKFEQAHTGTLFLDEIGDIPLVTQAKLLRVLQTKRFERVGGNETIQVDVRIIAATNRDLETAIKEGKFREDLFHRLNVVTISIPPLRERREDIPLLLDYFLDRFAAELGVDRPPLSPGALELLQAEPWTGNVRELEHCIHRAMIFTRGYPIQQDNILDALERPTGSVRSTEASSPFRVGMTLDAVEKQFIQMTLEATKGNKKEAARLLGISRRAIYDKLKRYGQIE